MLFTTTYSSRAENTMVIHTVNQMSMARAYDTRMLVLLADMSRVAMESTVVTPSDALAGTASRDRKKESQETVTMSQEEMMTWRM